MRDGPRGFRQDSSCPALLRILLASQPLARTGLSPSTACLSRHFRFAVTQLLAVLQPRICLNIHGLGSFRFARHYSGNRCFLSSPAGTKMFQFPALPHLPVCMAFSHAGFPIRTSPDLYLFAVPRGFSQLTTSFLASKSLGILRPLLFASLCFLRFLLFD